MLEFLSASALAAALLFGSHASAIDPPGTNPAIDPPGTSNAIDPPGTNPAIDPPGTGT